MTLANMRANGVRSLDVYCRSCNRSVVVNVDHEPGEITVPSFLGRFRCTRCGARADDVRPNWIERGVATVEYSQRPWPE